MGGDEDEAPAGESVPPPEGVSSESPPVGAGPSAPGRDTRRRRLEGVIPEIVRRAVELGVEKAQEAPDNLKHFVGDMKVPKEIGHYLLSQIDETKNGLFRVVANEIRDFLEQTNFAGELQNLLTTVQFEVNTTIRFTPNDRGRDKRRGGDAKTDAKADAKAEGKAEDETASDTAAEGEHRPTPLPKPEVKTAVHVRRDDRDRRKRP